MLSNMADQWALLTYTVSAELMRKLPSSGMVCAGDGRLVVRSSGVSPRGVGSLSAEPEAGSTTAITILSSRSNLFSSVKRPALDRGRVRAGLTGGYVHAKPRV